MTDSKIRQTLEDLSDDALRLLIDAMGDTKPVQVYLEANRLLDERDGEPAIRRTY